MSFSSLLKVAPFDHCDAANAHRALERFMPPLHLPAVSAQYYSLLRPGKPESASNS